MIFRAGRFLLLLAVSLSLPLNASELCPLEGLSPSAGNEGESKSAATDLIAKYFPPQIAKFLPLTTNALVSELSRLTPSELTGLCQDISKTRATILRDRAAEWTQRSEASDLLLKFDAKLKESLVGLSADQKRALVAQAISDTDRWYSEAAEIADRALGLRLLEWRAINEKRLSERTFPNEDGWLGYRSSSILTPYSAFAALLTEINPARGSTFTELGAGPGRGAVTLGTLRPDIHYTGYELLGERVQEGNAALHALGIKGPRLIQQNLSDPAFTLPPSDYYYLFNPFSESTFPKVYRDLEKVSEQKTVRVLITSNTPPPTQFNRNTRAKLERTIKLPGFTSVDVWVYAKP